MEHPENGYCCSDADMNRILDSNDQVIGYVCEQCGRIYKYRLVKED